MLPAGNRITRSDEFARVVRRGTRVGRATLAVHLLVDRDDPRPRAGFVVSKGVGGSVVRNRVVRRLRHAVSELMPGLPDSARLVVRALPPAAEAGPVLTDDLRAAVASAVSRTRRGERE
ncbi:MAG: ribonuclease P protein component [Propionibacteriales bacterium]|nr:ribonuclease P protein component [Propionibacteriales bacterium]